MGYMVFLALGIAIYALCTCATQREVFLELGERDLLGIFKCTVADITRLDLGED